MPSASLLTGLKSVLREVRAQIHRKARAHGAAALLSQPQVGSSSHVHRQVPGWRYYTASRKRANSNMDESQKHRAVRRHTLSNAVGGVLGVTESARGDGHRGGLT